MNRVSFGVQSFVDAEARAAGRMHTRAMCLGELARMRAAGVAEINVDLIVGLPRQVRASWRESVDVAIECGVPHVSVYMLEVDEDSRLGRELLRMAHDMERNPWPRRTRWRSGTRRRASGWRRRCDAVLRSRTSRGRAMHRGTM